MSSIKSRCPKCEKQGQDQKGDNLAVYSDGHAYCFACGYYKPAPLTEQLRSLSNQDANPRTDHPTSIILPGDSSFSIPPVALSWLRRYQITDKEIHDYKICWSDEKQLLYLPIYDKDTLLAFSARYFGPNADHPKYLTGGLRRDCFKVFGNRHGRQTPTILVEDFISAARIARSYCAIPLLRAHFPISLIFGLLKHTDCIRVWLDFNKAKEALKLTQRARQWVPDCDTIITELDPKDYSDEEINQFVTKSLKTNGPLLRPSESTTGLQPIQPI
jgi:hypothetical protein